MKFSPVVPFSKAREAGIAQTPAESPENFPKRVLLVCTNRHAQGAETHAVHFAAACRAQGIDCVIAAQPDGPITRLAEQQAVPVIALKITAAGDLLGLWRLWRILRRERFDVLLASDAREFLPVALAGRMAGVDTYLFRHVNFPLKRAEVWALTRLVRGFLPVSEYTRQVLLDRGVPAAMATVLYNPVAAVDTALCARWRGETRAVLGLAAAVPVVGYAGALLEYKGVFLLAEALNRAMTAAPDLHAVWVGPQPQHAAVLAAIDEPLRSRHRWVGWQDDVRPYYAAIDVLAVPSLCTEAFGRVSIEAQACGTPVLANRSAGGLQETLHEGVTGQLLPSEPAAWAAALVQWVQRPNRQAAPPTRPWVEAQFGTEAVIHRFCQLVASHRSRRNPPAALN